jgi:hypothetical protein
VQSRAIADTLKWIVPTSFYLEPRSMIRIFFTLSALSFVLLCSALLMGLTMGDLYTRPLASRETLQWATMHRLTGISAALAVVFVESVAVTYFVGTSRWCKEVVETYGFGREPVAASNRLKRKTFFWAVAGMLATVGIAALGGAADPATLRPNTKAWADWHLAGAISGIVFIVWTYFLAWSNIVANQAIIGQLVNEVQKVRRERGLEHTGSVETPA